MNVQETTGIRELAARELDQVAGGRMGDDITGGGGALGFAGVGAFIGLVICGICDWLLG